MIVRVERKWLTQAYVWADVEVAVGRGVDSRSCGEERVSIRLSKSRSDWTWRWTTGAIFTWILK